MDADLLAELEEWDHKLRGLLCGLAEIIEQAKRRKRVKKAEEMMGEPEA